ncbi:phosphate/phosphite/phosphonate ABC transporter substrate-binding protein [Sideroxydans lithotrophicus]|uniref:Phosphonate ABC transporter, periplasmic phosphonate-binding protein n=1 Tax=Sideroxydans lithotrophicus (strain ES-1) TaxID=580332 RepID=D5CSF6_SIDLE|nr:phosphate/phosphite/phosphonate ABC transporter substrate-binding protein [Sideroxydans lithotrophicus]ADE11892.1 phosphonate ABC transporter, periplasmic phosphonate-binding protein [Sideroxydans lithotrophicus ES-1]
MKWHVVALAALLIVGCGEQQEETYQPTFSERGADEPKEYIVGIHPLHNPKRLVEVYGPVIDYLNAAIPQARFRLEASRNYAEFEKKLYNGHFDFAMPNPYQTVRSLKYGYRVFGKMGNDELFRGIILVRRDSGISRVSDLKGKKVCYPAPTALAATMMPQYYLQTHGIDVKRDIENLYVGSQESSIMNVLRGHVAAAATWPVPWKVFQQEKPEMAAQLEVKWQTGTLPNNGWVARDDVPPVLTVKVGRALVDIGKTSEGRAILKRLGITRFEHASNETYRPVEQYLKDFSETVRPIEY